MKISLLKMRCSQLKNLVCRFFILFVFLQFASFLNAQESTVTIKGTVKDESGLSVIGASVVVKNTSVGTITDIDGNFELQIERSNPNLIFRCIGFIEQEVRLDPTTTTLEIVMKEDVEMLDEVVVVGYGTMKKSDFTGSVGHIGKEVIETKIATNVVDFLKGSIAGVNIGVNNDAGGGGSILIRGKSSIEANTSPLIVLDGSIFYGTLSDINPNDIESIDVLKDASATAVYGSKGSAGAIMITTKKGTSTKPIVNISSKIGFTRALPMPSATGPERYLQRRSDYLKTIDYFNPKEDQKKGLGYYDNPDALPSGVSKEQWASYDPSFSGDYTETWLTRLELSNPEISNYKLGKTTDWRDLVFRTGFRQDYNASVSGKTDKVNYYVSLGHTDNEGYKLGDDFKTTRGRVNIDTDIKKWLKIGVNAQFADRGTQLVDVDTGLADVMSPFASAYDDDGKIIAKPTGDDKIINPLLRYEQNKLFYKTQTLNASFFARLMLPYGFTFETNATTRWGWRKQYSYTSDQFDGVPSGGRAKRDEYSDYEWIVDNILKWNYRLNKIHAFDVTLVASSEKYSNWNTIATSEEFKPNGGLGFHNLGGGVTQITSSNDQKQTGKSYLGRVNYTLADKYIVTASIRRDGFSAFGAYKAYGNFPAFAAAWRISEENLLKNTAVSNLKLRLSWGKTGNRDIGRYASLSKLNTTQSIENGDPITGLWTDNMANRKLKWETTSTVNLGTDFGFFNNRLSGVLDLYSMQTTDLILRRSLPSITGFASVISNIGRVDNKGLELTLTSHNITIPKVVDWSTTFIYSTNRNTIKSLYGDMTNVLDEDGNVIGQRELDDLKNGYYIGHSLDVIKDYKMIGIWQLGEEEEAKKYGKTPGDIRLQDVDENGVLNENDKQFLGSRTPKYRMSLRNDFTLFEHFHLAFVFRGDFNYYGVDNMGRNEDNKYFRTRNSLWSDYWTPENPSNEYAKLGSNAGNPTATIYKKRDYVRLQNVSLGYSVPKSLLSKISVESLKLSFDIDNGFVVTNWDYYDPENMGTSPRIFTFGINVTL